MKWFWCNLRMFIWLTVLTGIFYPFVITKTAYFTMHEKAEGSFIASHDTIIGSSLIAQKFTSASYFWPRPSAVDYNPLPSGGSNLGPTSAALRKIIDERREMLIQAHKLGGAVQVPSELLFASGSGLDPHISPETAYFQMDRIIQARGLNLQIGRYNLKRLVDSHIEKKCFGFLGECYVNVLLLNKALDEQGKGDMHANR